MSRLSNRLKGAVAGIVAAARSKTPPPPAAPAEPPADLHLRHQLSYLSDVAELQRLELARLLDQNRRLNRRIDQLLIMQQRDHALRERLHTVLTRFADTPGPAIADDRAASAEARYRALRRSVGHLVGHLAKADASPPMPADGHPGAPNGADHSLGVKPNAGTSGEQETDYPAGDAAPRLHRGPHQSPGTAP